MITVKILILADYENNNLWGNWNERWSKILSDIDLVLSAGDLSSAYLEFITSKLNVPLLYIRGNHDSYYDIMPPKGCMDIDEKVVSILGIRIAGLGGSVRYREGRDMYTEDEQAVRVRRLLSIIKENLYKNGIDKNIKGDTNENRIDVFLTHAPCRGFGDLDDLPHTGFDCFNLFLKQAKPRVHLYGHVHMDYGEIDRVTQHPSGTTLINCYGMHIVEMI